MATSHEKGIVINAKALKDMKWLDCFSKFLTLANPQWKAPAKTLAKSPDFIVNGLLNK